MDYKYQILLKHRIIYCTYTVFQFHNNWCIYCDRILIISQVTIFFFFFKFGPSCLCWLLCPIDLIHIRLQNSIKIFKTTCAISIPQPGLHASGLLSLTSQALEVWSRSQFRKCLYLRCLFKCFRSINGPNFKELS